MDGRSDILDYKAYRYEFLISFGYRHILTPKMVDWFSGRAINVHIGMLPYNRGADPNLWSWIHGTPKGVTIHNIDYGIDTGDILLQQEVEMGRNETLRTSYEKLIQAGHKLLIENIDALLNQKITPRKQEGFSSYHRSSDKNEIFHLLYDGWDTRCADLCSCECSLDGVWGETLSRR